MKKQNAHWIAPFNDKIVVLPFPPDEISDGGLLIPDSVKKRPSKGTIISVGGGIETRSMEFEPGDVVFHVKDCGTLVQYNDVDYYIMSDKDVLAKLEN